MWISGLKLQTLEAEPGDKLVMLEITAQCNQIYPEEV
jgi:hypothetical protein